MQSKAKTHILLAGGFLRFVIEVGAIGPSILSALAPTRVNGLEEAIVPTTAGQIGVNPVVSDSSVSGTTSTDLEASRSRSDICCRRIYRTRSDSNF